MVPGGDCSNLLQGRVAEARCMLEKLAGKGQMGMVNLLSSPRLGVKSRKRIELVKKAVYGSKREYLSYCQIPK